MSKIFHTMILFSLIFLISNFQTILSENNKELIFVYENKNNLEIDAKLFEAILTSNSIQNINISQINSTCYDLTILNQGETEYNIIIPLIKPIRISNETKINETSKEIVCLPFTLYLEKKLNEITENLTKEMPNFLNETFENMTTSYDYEFNFKGFKTYNEIYSANYELIINYNLTSIDNETKIFTETKIEMFGSVIYNIPLLINVTSEGKFEIKTDLLKLFLPFTEETKETGTYVFNSTSKLKETNFNLKVSNFKNFTFNTNLGVNFIILTNSTLNEISVIGSEMKILISNEKNTKGFMYILYGSKELFITLSEIDVKIDKNQISFIPLYFFNYASLAFSYEHSQKEIKINLGVNAGSFSKKFIEKPIEEENQDNQFQLILIFVAIAIIVITIVIGFRLIKKRSKI